MCVWQFRHICLTFMTPACLHKVIRHNKFPSASGLFYKIPYQSSTCPSTIQGSWGLRTGMDVFSLKGIHTRIRYILDPATFREKGHTIAMGCYMLYSKLMVMQMVIYVPTGFAHSTAGNFYVSYYMFLAVGAL